MHKHFTLIWILNTQLYTCILRFFLSLDSHLIWSATIWGPTERLQQWVWQACPHTEMIRRHVVVATVPHTCIVNTRRLLTTVLPIDTLNQLQICNAVKFDLTSIVVASIDGRIYSTWEQLLYQYPLKRSFETTETLEHYTF